jgi:hypothetical protein
MDPLIIGTNGDVDSAVLVQGFNSSIDRLDAVNRSDVENGPNHALITTAIATGVGAQEIAELISPTSTNALDGQTFLVDIANQAFSS